VLTSGQTLITLDSAINSALRTHPQVQFSQQEIEQQKALKKGSFNLQNPELLFQAPYSDKFTTGVQQSMNNPLVYIQQSKVGKQNISLAEKGLSLSKAALIKEVKTAYLSLQFSETKVKQLTYQDSIFNNLFLVSERRFNAGDVDLLEKISAETKSKEIQNLLMQAKAELQNAQLQLHILCGLENGNIFPNQKLEKSIPSFSALLIGDTSILATNTFVQYYQQNIQLNKQEVKLERSKLAPGFTFGYLNQVGPGLPTKFRMFYGISIPLWFWTYTSQIKAANYKLQMANSQFEIAQKNVNSEYQQAITDYKKYFESLNYYESTGLKQAEAIINTATRSYDAGEISYIIYMQSLNQAFEIKINYLETVKNHNQSVIQLDYLNGQ
jgi:outer membrane protein, heavy metal efflux system